jgi:hypothetical protein
MIKQTMRGEILDVPKLRLMSGRGLLALIYWRERMAAVLVGTVPAAVLFLAQPGGGGLAPATTATGRQGPDLRSEQGLVRKHMQEWSTEPDLHPHSESVSDVLFAGRKSTHI